MSDETNKVSEPEVASAPSNGTAASAPKSGFFGKVDTYFGITKSGSNFKTEIIAGLTTFMTMVYILMVNAGFFELVIGGQNPYGAAYIATAVGAIAGTLLMAFLAKMPLAQASGMGVNAFVVFTLINFGARGLTYANCMVFTLLDGLIFLILTATGLRKKIFDAIPEAVRHAIPVGIGLFIAFIGFQNAGVIVANKDTLVTFVSFNVLDKANTYGDFIAPLVALVGVVAIAILSKKEVKGSILWGILASTALYYVLVGIGYAINDPTCVTVIKGIKLENPISAFTAWGKDSAGKVFYEGFDFSAYFTLYGDTAVASFIILLLTTSLSLCMLDMFDTIGTLYSACAKGNLLDENGVPLNMNKSMLADAIATCVGAAAGTSTVTTFVESASGVAAGGKTGFTALVVALCFIVATFLSPIAQLVPSCATATALIWVGVLMMTSVVKVKWEDPADAIIAFCTFIFMALGYSISTGIGLGILVYIIVKICTGEVKKVSVATWLVGALFLAMFLLTKV